MEEIPFDIPLASFRAYAARWRVRELALFGSILRPDFRSDSDVDVLVTFEDPRPSLFDLVAMEDDLKELIGRDVDLIERKAVEQSHNWIRRQDILSSAMPIYTTQ